MDDPLEGRGLNWSYKDDNQTLYVALHATNRSQSQTKVNNSDTPQPLELLQTEWLWRTEQKRDCGIKSTHSRSSTSTRVNPIKLRSTIKGNANCKVNKWQGGRGGMGTEEKGKGGKQVECRLPATSFGFY